VRARTLLLSLLTLTAAQALAADPPASQPTVPANPAVREGIEISCRPNRLVLTPGTAIIDGKPVKTRGGEVGVPPAEIVEITDLPITLVAESVQSWRIGATCCPEVTWLAA
jgi:hypothetical protein